MRSDGGVSRGWHGATRARADETDCGSYGYSCTAADRLEAQGTLRLGEEVAFFRAQAYTLPILGPLVSGWRWFRVERSNGKEREGTRRNFIQGRNERRNTNKQTNKASERTDSAAPTHGRPTDRRPPTALSTRSRGGRAPCESFRAVPGLTWGNLGRRARRRKQAGQEQRLPGSSTTRLADRRSSAPSVSAKHLARRNAQTGRRQSQCGHHKVAHARASEVFSACSARKAASAPILPILLFMQLVRCLLEDA